MGGVRRGSIRAGRETAADSIKRSVGTVGLGDHDTRPQEPGRSDTERIVRVLRNRSWLIVACLATVTGVALFGSLLQEKQYTATASLLFRDPGFAQNVFGTDFQAQTDP